MRLAQGSPSRAAITSVREHSAVAAASVTKNKASH